MQSWVWYVTLPETLRLLYVISTGIYHFSCNNELSCPTSFWYGYLFDSVNVKTCMQYRSWFQSIVRHIKGGGGIFFAVMPQISPTILSAPPIPFPSLTGCSASCLIFCCAACPPLWTAACHTQKEVAWGPCAASLPSLLYNMHTAVVWEVLMWRVKAGVGKIAACGPEFAHPGLKSLKK